MTLSSAVTALAARWRDATERWSRLDLAISAARRQDLDRAVVEDMRAAVEDFGGTLREGAEAVDIMVRAPSPTDLQRTRDALAQASHAHQRIASALHDRLLAFDTLAELSRVGAQHGTEGRKWVVTVREQAQRCVSSVWDLGAALLECWKELAERAGAPVATAHATATGQQIRVAADDDAVEGRLGGRT